MTLVLNLCDHIHVLDQGRIIASGPPAAIRSNRDVADAYLGKAHDPADPSANGTGPATVPSPVEAS